MHDAIKLILASAFAAPALGGCSRDQNPDQNLVITNTIPPDAQVEALPSDEGGGNDEALAVAAQNDENSLANAD